jgi:pyruvate formate-lyase activating enzyme-like uncharacterized protein
MPDVEVEARDRPCGGLLQGDLPQGCGLCSKGAKLVLFVTGVCHYDCFYCPVGEERRDNHGAWANERYIPPEDVGAGPDLEAIRDEVEKTRARGTGLTGGDPMYDPERTLRFIRFLKDEFGEEHHIHIYTQIPFDEDWLGPLHEAGLDEFRFHPPEEIWSDVDAHEDYASLYRAAQTYDDWDVGFEIPCIPGWSEETQDLVRWLDENGFPFLNLNEFEFSPTNAARLRERGHEVEDDVTSKAKGSAEVAREVMKAASDRGTAVHFCSSPFKDAIQLRARLRRRAEQTAGDHEVVTEDATVLRGILDPGDGDPHAVAEALQAELDVPPDLLVVRQGPPAPASEAAEPGASDAPSPPATAEGGMAGSVATTGRDVGPVTPDDPSDAPSPHPDGPHLEVAPWILDEVGEALPWDSWISEVYPTSRGLEVERIPTGDGARLSPAD